MSKNDLAIFLAKHPVFTHEEFKEFWGRERTANQYTIDTVLKYHTKKGHIARIKRGLYITLSPLDTKDKYYLNPNLVAVKLAPDAVLAYHSAIEIHGKGYATYWYLYYLTSTHVRPIKIGQYHYQPLHYPKALVKKNKCNYGVETTTYEYISIRVTSLERTLVDCLDKLSISGGWEEIWRSFDTVRYLNWDTVIEYCLLLENATLCSKLGFYLDQRKNELSGLEPAYLQVLEKRIPKSVHYMERIARSDKFEKWRFIKRWNLMVPEGDITRNWDEINLQGQHGNRHK
jgi:predicted transcriptional regulator of viral defense system